MVEHLELHALAESSEYKPPIRVDMSLIPARVNSLTYKPDTCCFVAWQSILISEGKDWLAECQDNVTEWDIGLSCWWPDFPVVQHYQVDMSVYWHKSVPVMG